MKNSKYFVILLLSDPVVPARGLPTVALRHDLHFLPWASEIISVRVNNASIGGSSSLPDQDELLDTFVLAG